MKDFLPEPPEVLSDERVRNMNSTVVAFIGDAVQTLYTRVMFATVHDNKTAALHRMTSNVINASAQSRALKNIMPLLTEEEASIYKRSRNAVVNTRAKNADIIDYRIATGFEGLIGHLYLTGKHARLNELLSLAYKPQE